MLNVFISRQRPHLDYEDTIYNKFQNAAGILRAQGVATFGFMRDAVLKGQPANYPDIEILHPECCFLDGELAKRITCRAIQADPELNGIFVSSMGRRGVAKALQETGTAGKIHMIIHDITPSNLSLVRQGIVDFVIGQDIETQDTRPIQILYEYLSNHQMPEQRIQLTDISIKFRCNIPPEA